MAVANRRHGLDHRPFSTVDEEFAEENAVDLVLFSIGVVRFPPDRRLPAGG
jgi:hypothetical protein